MYLTLAFEVRVIVQKVRDIALILDDSCLLELKNYLYVFFFFYFRKNLILVSRLCKQNYSLVFNNKHVFIKMNDLFICSK